MTDDTPKEAKVASPAPNGSEASGDADVRRLGRIGQFEMVRKIGQGGMGAVYLAQQVSLGRPVAVKILPDSLAQNKAFVDRFHREARAAAGLSHPNLIQVYDAGLEKGMHFFAMEFIEGETLATKIEREGPMTEHSALAASMCVAAALHHAWVKAQLIHRDIKPDNIMLTTDGRIKVCDLGLAKSAGHDSALTVTGTMMGTPQYISPEQACGESDIDTRADIYSLGATLHHLVTGQPPFQADTQMGVLYKHVNEPLPDPRKLNPALSENFVRILQKMMAKDRNARYQDMLDLYNDFERCYEGSTPNAATKGQGKTSIIHTPLTPDQVAMRSLQRGLMVWRAVGVGLVLLLLVGGGIWYFKNHRSAVPQQKLAKAKSGQHTGTNAVSAAAIKAAAAQRKAAAASATNAVPVKPSPSKLADVPRTLPPRKARNNPNAARIMKARADAESKAAAQRAADAETERKKLALRAKHEAQLKAETEYRDFLNIWQPLVAARNYTDAEIAATSAVKDPVLAPIKERLATHQSMSTRLKLFHEKFRGALPQLKGKSIVYDGFSGTVGDVDEKTVTIEKVAGAGRSFPLSALRIDQLLTLALVALDANDPQVRVDFGLVSLAEGRTDWARQYFDQARLLDQSKDGGAKAAAQKFDDLRETIARVPTEATAAAAINELDGMLTASKWADAAAKLTIVTKQFADTTTLQCSADRLQDMHDTIIAAEAGPGELQAQLTLNSLRQDIARKDWRHAAQMFLTLNQRFLNSEAVQNAEDWQALRDQLAANVPEGTLPKPPGIRDSIMARKGATIIQPESTTKGLNPVKLLGSLLQKTKDGDGIELPEGLYSCRNLYSSAKTVSIFGKPGTLPILQVAPGKIINAGFEVTGSDARWRFENIMFISYDLPSTNASVEPLPPNVPILLSEGASVEFNQCIFAVRGDYPKPTALVRCKGSGGEIIFRNCVFVRACGVEMLEPRRIRASRCTWMESYVIALAGASASSATAEVTLTDNLIISPENRGFIHAPTPTTAARLAAQLDLTASRNNVIELPTFRMLEDWRAILDQGSKGPNYLTLSTDEPALAMMPAGDKFDYHLAPDCPAAHAAEDGQAVGVRWPTEIWDQVKLGVRSVSSLKAIIRAQREAAHQP